MVNFKQKLHNSPGQAIVEFALVLVVLLAMIFLIIESGRILWAWNSVQHAAREGARYAVTGQFDGPNCPIDFGADKFLQPGGRDLCAETSSDWLRAGSVIREAHDALTGLPLNEVTTRFEDDNYYNIELWGVNGQGQLQYDFAGLPTQPVIVRVTYQVPIITPFFRPIRTTMPVFGQTTMLNENFGQQTTDAQGMALPPQIPIIPTAGVTPSPTPSPTPSNTPTPGPTSTSTHTPTPTPCNVAFEGYAIAGTNFVAVSGDIGTTVTIIDLTTGRTLGVSSPLLDRSGHVCPGYIDITGLSENLTAGNVLLAESSDGTTDTIIVLDQPPSPTPTFTYTPMPTNTATHTPTTVPTATPGNPYIVLVPDCGEGPTVQVSILGFNWDNNEAVGLSWDGVAFHVIPAGHGGTFSFTRTFTEPDGTYTLRAESVASPAQVDIDTADFDIPCLDLVIPTATPTLTATPIPADLTIGRPELISTPPIVAHAPLDFRVAITNLGEVDVNQQFFVDVYLDPQNVLTDRIPLNESSGYIAVDSLLGGQSKTLTFNAPLGFMNTPDPHSVYGMVDSVQQVVEEFETNNVSTSLSVPDVTPAAPPTATPTPNGADSISGAVNIRQTTWLPQFRAVVQLIHPSLGIIAKTQSDFNGFYTFSNIPPLPDPDRYTVTACAVFDTGSYFGIRTGIQSPSPFGNVYMLSGPCS